MFSKRVNIFQLPSLSLATKLVMLYALSTIGILSVACLLLYSTFIDSIGQNITSLAITFCYKRVLVVLLVGSLAAIVMGILVTHRGLTKINEFSKKIDMISADFLNQRIAPSMWPVELKKLAGKFNMMLDKIQSSFNQLSDFSSDIAHELRGPIHNLMGVTEVALTNDSLPEKYRHILDSYMNEYTHLSKLIENLLFLARTDHGQIEIDKKIINAKTEINHVCDYYQAMADENRVELTCHGEADIAADPVLFKRIISNILSNALRYTPNDGRINIAIIPVNAGYAKITIQDSGVGIADSCLPKIFDRFYRVDSSRTLQSGGMGLGLAIVKSIVDLHRGKITIDSKLNSGTAVTLLLPAML